MKNYKVLGGCRVALLSLLGLGLFMGGCGEENPAPVASPELLDTGAESVIYRMVTLPGERAFLADPEVRKILERYARPLVIDAQAGTCLGVELGLARADVVNRLGINSVNELTRQEGDSEWLHLDDTVNRRPCDDIHTDRIIQGWGANSRGDWVCGEG